MLSNSERTVIKEALDLVKRETENDGDSLVLKGFGTFKRKSVAARTARNPQTGDPVQVPARSVLKFKSSKKMTRDI